MSQVKLLDRPVGETTRDTRPLGTKISYWLFQPRNFLAVLGGLVALELLVPAAWPLWGSCVGVLWIGLVDSRFKLPLRMPKDVGGIDPSDVLEFEEEAPALFGLSRKRVVRRVVKPADGVLYFGKQRSADPWANGQELWASASDACTHLALAGTTGAGKTRALLALAFNSMLWGAGVLFADGKASSDLAYEMWCMARSRGREDSFLVLSFLTGGRDPFVDMAQRPGSAGAAYKPFQSNSIQPFADGEASFILQLLASLMRKASGDGAQWQAKALNMADAVIRILCYKRAMGEGDTSIPTIRETFALENLVKFYIEGREGKLPELAFLPIKAYFETSLPGFVPGNAANPETWTAEVRNQHGYLTGQFARMLSMMMDSYGHVFSDRLGEIDMTDVLLNNRTLVVLIPSMEKSEEEAAALGKLFLSSVRLMMANNLGHQLEGTRHDIVDVKATNTAFPTLIITDELGYYFAPGMAVMYAQARALKFMMVAAFQDEQALKRGEGSEEVASLIANTKFKYCMALEDPNETFELFRKAAGQSAVDVVAGYEANNALLGAGWDQQQSTRIEVRDRLDVLELKRLDSGQGVIIFKDQVVRSTAFYIDSKQLSSTTVPARINRFLQVPPPAYADVPEHVSKAELETRKGRIAEREIAGALFKRVKPPYPALDDPILDALAAAASHMDALPHQHFTPNERAIVLLEAARAKLSELKREGRGHFWHDPIKAAVALDDDPEELTV